MGFWAAVAILAAEALHAEAYRINRQKIMTQILTSKGATRPASASHLFHTVNSDGPGKQVEEDEKGEEEHLEAQEMELDEEAPQVLLQSNATNTQATPPSGDVDHLLAGLATTTQADTDDGAAYDGADPPGLDNAGHVEEKVEVLASSTCFGVADGVAGCNSEKCSCAWYEQCYPRKALTPDGRFIDAGLCGTSLLSWGWMSCVGWLITLATVALIRSYIMLIEEEAEEKFKIDMDRINKEEDKIAKMLRHKQPVGRITTKGKDKEKDKDGRPDADRGESITSSLSDRSASEVHGPPPTPVAPPWTPSPPAMGADEVM